MFCTKSFLFLPVLLICFAQSSEINAASLELYNNFHTMGVLVTLESGEDPEMDAVVSLHYRKSGSTYVKAFPLTRTEESRFVGSLFWLTARTTYDVRVTFDDPTSSALNGMVLNAISTTRTEIAFPDPSERYYVSPTGSGSNFSEENPGSLSDAINLARAGEEIILFGGTYYWGGYTMPRSGNNGSPITIRCKSGETAILDGSDPSDFTWIFNGNGVYSTSLNVTNTKLVLAAGKRLYQYKSYADLENLAWGTAGFYEEDGRLYVKLDGELNPGTVEMNISIENYCFYIDQKDYCYIRDIHFRNYGQGDYAKAIYFNNSSHNVVDHCTFGINNLGIGIKRESHRITIQNCEFYDDTDDWDWDGMKASYVESTLLSFYDPVYGRGHVIRNNIFHDCMDGMTPSTFYENPKTTEMDIYNNIIYNAGDDAISADGWTSNVRLWNNTMYDVLVGISFAPVIGGPVYAVRNLIYKTGIGTNNYTGMSFKFNSGYPKSGTIYLFHNTCDAAIDGDGFELRSPGSWDHIYARNNIWAGTRYAFRNVNTEHPIDFDYDNLYTSDISRFAEWSGIGKIKSLEEFQNLTSLERNGINVEPGFVSPATGTFESETKNKDEDYHLKASSACIDVGMLIPGINYEFHGTAPDLGAFEYDPGTSTVRKEIRSERIPYKLNANVPNPFNSETTITYQIAQDGHVTMRVYNFLGRYVAELVNEFQEVGQYAVQLSANELSSGVYLCRIQSKEFTDVKKMIVLK